MESSGGDPCERGPQRGGGGGVHASAGTPARVHQVPLQPGHQLYQPGSTQVSTTWPMNQDQVRKGLFLSRKEKDSFVIPILTTLSNMSTLLIIDIRFKGRSSAVRFPLLKADSCHCCFRREAASNFLTALSLQRKSRSRQQCQQVMSGNIWAALRIALSMLDQPELFQAANIGDLDLLMRAFNLDI